MFPQYRQQSDSESNSRHKSVVYTSVRLAALRADEHGTKVCFSRRRRGTAVGMPLDGARPVLRGLN